MFSEKLIFSGIFAISFFITSFAFAEPSVLDPNYKVEKVITGLNFPVQMEFIGTDILVIQKNDGNVRLIEDGQLQEDPILHFEVENRGLEGLLGIEVVESNVYFYVTQLTDNLEEPEVNRIYQYRWDGKNLIDGELVNELSGNPNGHDHVGGVLTSDDEKNVYGVIGDLFRRGFLQNSGSGLPDDSGIILRVGLDEKVTRPYLSDNPFDHYYGIGIRNSYGLAFDPVTGFLWQTENGPENNDEINLVMPGFNSGWRNIMGKANQTQLQELPEIPGFRYSDPEFTWEIPIGPTQLLFPISDNFRKYNDTLFVGNVLTNMIHKFQFNSTRTGFEFVNPDLKDLELNKFDNGKEIIFASGFNGIVDLDLGPDGNIYVLTIYDGGSIYRISPIPSNERISPLEQNNSGVLLSEVQCQKKLVLIEKLFTNEGVCVKPKSVENLVERNWAGLLSTDISHNCSRPPSPGVDWSNCNFSFTDLSGLNLEKSNLNGGNFVGSDLSKSNLSNSNLNSADFTASNLSEANLSKSAIKITKLIQANLENANLFKTDLTKSSMTQASLLGANLSNSKLTDSYLLFSNLQNTDFSKSDLSGAALKGSNFLGTNFSDANMTKSNLGDKPLSNSELNGCYGHSFCED